MPRIYFYKLTTDNGGAPCVTPGLLSLAICKPMIRSTAETGDLIFGFAARSLDRNNRLIYIAEITEKLRDGRYFKDRRFSRRGDCIYEWRRREQGFAWRRGAQHHGPNDLIHDLGARPYYQKANVLLSTNFRYFGATGTDQYKSRYPCVARAVEELGRGHRVWRDEELYNELDALKREAWESAAVMMAGNSTSRPQQGVCHRSTSCGEIGSPEDV